MIIAGVMVIFLSLAFYNTTTVKYLRSNFTRNVLRDSREKQTIIRLQQKKRQINAERVSTTDSKIKGMPCSCPIHNL